MEPSSCRLMLKVLYSTLSENETENNKEDKKRSLSEEDKLCVEVVDAIKRQRTESPAPALLGGQVEETVQEKDTFSDISDDVDDILNQEVSTASFSLDNYSIINLSTIFPGL